MSKTAQIQLENFDASKIDLDKTIEEIEQTKKQIDEIRNKINNFLSILASVPDSVNETEFFHSVATKLFELRDELSSYLKKYNNIAPIIELSRQANGFKSEKFGIVELKPLVVDKSYLRKNSRILKAKNGNINNQKPKKLTNSNFKTPTNKFAKTNTGKNNSYPMTGTSPGHSIVL